MRIKWLFMLAIFGLIHISPATAIAAPAQAGDKLSINKARIDAALKQMVTDGRAAGTSALIWKDGREIYFGTSGDADREAKRPMRRDTIIQIFSMTKPVTGVALMQLWEQGKFGLDDPIATYLPEFANMQTYVGTDANGVVRYRPATRQITIRDVMRHTAGFANSGAETPAHVAYTKANPSGLDHDLAEMGRRLATVPLLYDPGERWYYGIAPDVQALLIEKISGQSYAAYVKQYIFDPLGMKDTGWRQPDANFARFSAMYNLQEGKLVRVADDVNKTLNFQDNKLIPGAYGLASTLDDYMRFARMLLGNGELDGVRLLKPSTIKLMASDHLDPRMTDRSWLPSKGAVGFGFNFAVRHSQPKNADENRGAVGEYFWDGAATNMFWVDPANNMAAVYFVQTQPFTATLQRDFRAAVYGKDYLGPKGD